MDIRQLNYFIEVAKYMSFSKAAGHLNVSQPSLSKMVKNLEEELGVLLFDRTTKKVQLTDAGHVVFGQAQEIMKLIHHLSSELSDVMQLKKGSIKIGVPPVIGSLFFPKVVSDFKSQFPQIEIDLVEEGAKVIEKLVEEGNVDVGVALLPINQALFETYPFATRELKLIVDTNHRLANFEQVPLRALKEETFVFLKENFALHDRIFEACLQSGFEPNISFESSQWDFVSEMVANGLGISIFPEMLCQKLDPKRIKSVSIVDPVILWDLTLIWRKNKYLSYVSKEFIQFFRQTFQTPLENQPL